MAISDYLQQASSSLTKAAEEKLREAEEKRRLLDMQEREIRSRINNLQQYRRQKESAASNANVDDSERTAVLKRAQDDNQEIGRLEGELRTLRSQYENDIREAERIAQELNRQASDIMSRAAEV